MTTSGKEEGYIQLKKPKKKKRERIWEDTRRTDVSICIYILHLYTDYSLQITEGHTEYEVEFSNDIVSISHSRTTQSTKFLGLVVGGGNLIFF